MNDTADTTTTLAVLGERLSNVMSSVAEIKDSLQLLATRKEIAELVSRAEHSAAIVDLSNRISTLERQTPARLMDTIVKLSVSLSAVVAAGTLVVHLIKG